MCSNNRIALAATNKVAYHVLSLERGTTALCSRVKMDLYWER